MSVWSLARKMVPAASIVKHGCTRMNIQVLARKELPVAAIHKTA